MLHGGALCAIASRREIDWRFGGDGALLGACADGEVQAPGVRRDFVASAARMAEKNGGGSLSSNLIREEEQYRLQASTRHLQDAVFINALAALVDVLMGWRGHGETMYCCPTGDYDDFFF